MMAVVHRTYTEFDIRALTIQGLSAKPAAPGEQPIGKFGTGLKYAIGVLMREGHSVTIVTPEGRHKVVKKADSFRDLQYDGLFLRTRLPSGRFKRTQLPFTTHYGSNWELWMAFRELHSNTLDEGGWTKGFSQVPADCNTVSEGCAIIVEGEGYEQEFFNSHNTFLNIGYEPVLSTPSVDIYELPHDDYVTEFKYYRGLRAGKAPQDKMMRFIYNVKAECYLSEERQVSDHYWDWHVMQAIAECDDESLIKRFLEAEDDFWESTVIFNNAMRFGDTFMGAAGYAKVPARHYEMIEAKRPKSIETLAVEEYPTPWRVNSYSVVSDNGNMVATKPAGMSSVDFEALWADRVAAINEHSPSASFQLKPAEAAPEADDAPSEAPVDPDEGVQEADFLTDEEAES